MSQGHFPKQALSLVFGTKSRLFRLSIVLLVAELLLAILLGWLAQHVWGGGMIWLLAGMMAGAIVVCGSRSLYQISVPPHVTARKIGQALVGLSIGFSIAHSDLAAIAGSLPIFILLTLFLMLNGIVIGYLYSRFSRTNLFTSMLATVPGGVSIMSSIAADYNHDVALVSLMQIIRVTAVIVLLPLIARLSVSFSNGTVPSASGLSTLPIASLALLSLALLLAGLNTTLATRCKIPAAPFMGSILAGILFNPLINTLPIATIDFSPPPLINILGQLLLGVTIGEYWGYQSRIRRRTIVFALVSAGMTLTAGFLACFLAMQITHWDWLTCMLVTAPGGAPEMILVALSLNHHVETVTTAHLVRLIAINASLPLWVLFLRRLSQSTQEWDNCP